MPQNNQNILVIKLSALGDFMQALGPMKAIREHHKDAKITLMTTKMFANFGEKCGYFDEIIIDSRPKWKDLKGWINLRKQLVSGSFSRVYDLQNNDRSCFYLKLFTGNKKPEWVGTAKGASHRNVSPERTAGLSFDGHKQTLQLAGLKNIKIDTLDWVKEDISHFNIKNPYVLIVPGSAPQHPQKRWSPENYAALCNLLSNENTQPVLIGTDAEKDVTTKIKSLCNSALDLTGKTSLFQIAALAKNAQAAIGNDTGPMHIISPTGCPALILFSGNSNPKRHAPMGENVKTIQKKAINDITVAEAKSLLFN